MDIRDVTERGAAMADAGEERRTTFGQWAYYRLGEVEDETVLTYTGDSPFFAGTSIPLMGNTDAQAFHVAYRKARGVPLDLGVLRAPVEGAGAVWWLDDAGNPPPVPAVRVPSPEEIERMPPPGEPVPPPPPDPIAIPPEHPLAQIEATYRRGVRGEST